MTKLTSVRLLILFVVTHQWQLHQLDIKNAFLHDFLDEEIYMEQPLALLLRPQGESRQTENCVLKQLKKKLRIMYIIDEIMPEYLGTIIT